MAQLEHIEAIEKRLWSAADNLRANSNFASNEYFLPVMGLIFLRHAYSRFLAVHTTVLHSMGLDRSGKPKLPKRDDYARHGALMLRAKSQFDYLVSLPEKEHLAQAIVDAMEAIEKDYPQSLQGVLPKNEYYELDNDVLRQILRTLNPEELKQVKGDVFGRIYEYFLTQFADQKAHDGGEFFTPISLVSLIANILEPTSGKVLDPACGSGGMFVQSARVVERLQQNPSEKLTFYGLEKNATTIRLAKMNLAVHGLEGNIMQSITYYDDPHNLHQDADYVMANPPFNVDEIDADKVKKDPRLPFGLPGVNKKQKVSNGNYVWISYFYSYLNKRGKAGFVMSSQSSSAGRAEATVRQKLIETGAVDIMVAIRSNFFYTRTVPCELWFLDRGKPEHLRDKVLMIDARNVYRKVTRKIYDFSPEQEQNLLAIVWLYRGQTQRYLDLLTHYCNQTLDAGLDCFTSSADGAQDNAPLAQLQSALAELISLCQPFLKNTAKKDALSAAQKALAQAQTQLAAEIDTLSDALGEQQDSWLKAKGDNASLVASIENLEDLAERSRKLLTQCDQAYKAANKLIDVCVGEMAAKSHNAWHNSDIKRALKELDRTRSEAVEQLKAVRYPWRQAHWLSTRFADAELCDVPGLVKLVDRTEIEANDWSLTPGRYVGVAPEEEDEDFDFAATMKQIHSELADLDAEATRLAAQIQSNFQELGL